MKKIYLLIFLTSVAVFQVFGQNKKADKLFKYYDYAEAITYYLKAADEGSVTEQEYATLKLAECYRHTNNAPKAKEWYEKAVQIESADPINYFYLGQALRTLGEYKEAAEAFSKFNELVPDHAEGLRYYQFCIDIEEWVGLPVSAEIKNIDELNSEFADFCPVFYRDGIVFASDRYANKYVQSNIYGWTNSGFLNLFYTIPKYYKVYWNGVPEPVEMSNDFNQTFHDGPVSFSKDHDWIYVTRTVQKNSKKLDGNIKTHLLKIFFAKITGDKKPKFEEFPFNSKEYSVGHPSLSANGEKLIFSSDMPGGYGGSDLYMSVKENGKWNDPVNLGDKVNSIGNEVFPYWATEDVLFFSSDGHLGFGGLDVFQTVFESEVWETPENLKQPINSSYDDFGIVTKENLTEGLFSSNRPEGKGSDDIYGFKRVDNVEQAVPQLAINGRVVDSKNIPLSGATVFLLDPLTNNAKVLISDENGVYSDGAAYNQNYVVKAMKDGYIYDCTSFRTPAGEIASYQIPRDLVLMKLEINQVFKVENIYYDLDKWYIREDAQPPLDSLVMFMKQYPITAELSSHTDSRASNEYNMELSQKRAESAVRYIVLQGVDPLRITAKGYGETRLVNKCADDVACTEEEHQQNRRTEFKITSIGSSADGGFFDLSNYVKGDIIPAATLGAQFFANCNK